MRKSSKLIEEVKWIIMESKVLREETLRTLELSRAMRLASERAKCMPMKVAPACHKLGRAQW